MALVFNSKTESHERGKGVPFETKYTWRAQIRIKFPIIIIRTNGRGTRGPVQEIG